MISNYTFLQGCERKKKKNPKVQYVVSSVNQLTSFFSSQRERGT